MRKTFVFIVSGMLLAGPAAAGAAAGTPSRSDSSGVQELLRLLEDADPQTRAQAARALKAHVHDPQVERRLVSVLERWGEEVLVRKEAVRSLSWATRNDSTKRRVLDLARGGEPEPLRAMAVKALWPVAGTDYGVKSALLEALSRAPETSIRAAAAWTLFAADQHHDARRALVDAIRDPAAAAAVRIEAAKSLFTPMIHYEVKRPVMEVAANPQEDRSIRESATLALMGANHDYEVQSFLERQARNDPDPALRAAAVRAQEGLTLEWARHFHLAAYRRHGQVIPLDPLESE